MHRESEERKLIKKTLLKKGQMMYFPLEKRGRVVRMLTDMNRRAREQRIVGAEDVLFSINSAGAPQGQFYVIRNY